MPLAAAPGYGEIHGLGEGLYAWFGIRLSDAVKDLQAAKPTPAKLRAFKHALALLISVRAPSVFLVDERSSLEDKVSQFTRLMARDGVIDGDFAAQLQDTPIKFLPTAPLPPQPSSGKNKAANAIRVNLMEALGMNNLYDLESLAPARRQHHRCTAAKARDRLLRPFEPTRGDQSLWSQRRAHARSRRSGEADLFIPAGRSDAPWQSGTGAGGHPRRGFGFQQKRQTRTRQHSEAAHVNPLSRTDRRAAQRIVGLDTEAAARARQRRPRSIDQMGGGNLARP